MRTLLLSRHSFSTINHHLLERILPFLFDVLALPIPTRSESDITSFTIAPNESHVVVQNGIGLLRENA
ncbi:hypothetical protein CDV36_000012 [Fusarium kuroshium]|uniref:Uncharacterized protein n=2 Tax=Fusarium solani species complex TaxID=232080 RepID=A0A3M2SSH5_9HYPO|nr:hypothetical protein CDV36_000012 [Fusarium kuroshium]RSM15012.1 hypothetical protein CEP52_001141 [Fusarium oligoseptatum]